MPNLRILYDNKADTTSSLVASTTAGSLVAANLLNETKSSVHRSTVATVRYTASWSSLVTLNMVALLFNNLKSTATMRARVYTNTADVVDVAVPAIDSGAVLCCGYAPFGSFRFGVTPLAVNAFRYGGFAHARAYFTATQGRKLVVDITDVDNTAGYIEAARLLTGAYWELECNPAYGAELGFDFKTRHRESDAGDLRTEARPKKRTLNVNLDWIKTAADRLQFYEMMMNCGMDAPMFVSLFPEAQNPVFEQQYQIYGKLSGNTKLAHPKYGVHAAPLQWIEV